MDAGATWTQLPGTVGGVPAGAFDYVNEIVVSPNDSNRVYAGTRTGVWRSLDAGVTWTAVLRNPQYLAGAPATNGSLVGCTDLVVRNDRSPDVLFAAFGSGDSDGLFRSLTGGGHVAGLHRAGEPGAHVARARAERQLDPVPPDGRQRHLRGARAARQRLPLLERRRQLHGAGEPLEPVRPLAPQQRGPRDRLLPGRDLLAGLVRQRDRGRSKGSGRRVGRRRRPVPLERRGRELRDHGLRDLLHGESAPALLHPSGPPRDHVPSRLRRRPEPNDVRRQRRGHVPDAERGRGGEPRGLPESSRPADAGDRLGEPEPRATR